MTPDAAPALTDTQLDELESAIDAWAATQLVDNPAVLAVDRADDVPRRWFIRVAGDDKPVYAIWLTLRQRTLQYETFVAPSPPQEREAVFDQLLRRNASLHGLAFTVGDEDAIFLQGSVAGVHVSDDVLDGILGSIWMAVEQSFAAILRLGFGRT